MVPNKLSKDIFWGNLSDIKTTADSELCFCEIHFINYFLQAIAPDWIKKQQKRCKFMMWENRQKNPSLSELT